MAVALGALWLIHRKQNTVIMRVMRREFTLYYSLCLSEWSLIMPHTLIHSFGDETVLGLMRALVDTPGVKASTSLRCLPYISAHTHTSQLNDEYRIIVA